MEHYEVTPSADKDLGEIFAYVAEVLKVPDTATKLVSRIYDDLKSLSSMPRRYPLSRDAFLAKQGFRIMPTESYLAFYIVDDVDKRVTVHRVLYARRQYATLFSTDENA